MFLAPFLFIYVVIFFFALAILFGLIEIGIIRYAFEQIGLPPRAAFAALLASLFGSYINIPIARLEGGERHPAPVVDSFGLLYRVPSRQSATSTVLAVNVGGALVPVVIVVYLLSHNHNAVFAALLATAFVAFVANRFARPVPGLGIAMPMFVAPAAAAIAALLLAPSGKTSVVAYVSGVMGTLLGADIANLHHLRKLGAPVASIGGAGTFDGIFLTGIVAALLA